MTSRTQSMRLSLAIAICIVGSSLASAETLTEEEAVEAAAESLNGSIDFPWYDAEADGMRRIDVKPPRDLKNRQSDWLKKTKKKKKKKQTAMSIAWKDVFWSVMRAIGWLAVAVAFVAVGYLLVRAFLMAEKSSISPSNSSADDDDPRSDVDRVESLPFQLKQPLADLLSQARREYEAGNFANAIVYLYSYQLVELDKHQLIRLTKGKTNRQYLREVRSRSNLSGLLRDTMLIFEDVFFGNHALERKRFETCWTNLDEFHQGLEQVVA